MGKKHPTELFQKHKQGMSVPFFLLSLSNTVSY